MKRELIPWLLTGALGASLTWNVRAVCDSDDAARREPYVGTMACGELDPIPLQLSAEQERALSSACGLSCARTKELETRAQAVLSELWLTLREEELDTDHARRLARRVGELRGQALEACVDSVVAVRELLTPAQVERLLDSCGLLESE